MIYDIVKKLIDLGLTQTEIARKTNVPQARLSEILSGVRKSIYYESGKRLEFLLLETEKSKLLDDKRQLANRRTNTGRRTIN